jgi:uncharacterized protein YfbU (UPF0304 family)
MPGETSVADRESPGVVFLHDLSYGRYYVAVITLRVDDATRDEVERVARTRGVTVSELLRQAIAEVVGHKEVLREAIGDMFGEEVDVRRTDVPRSMSLVDRHMLALLHEILDHLDPSDGQDDKVEGHRRLIEVLQAGFTGEYVDEFLALQPEISVNECELLWDLLDMFRILKASMAKLDPSQVAALGEHADHALTFQGFDIQDPRESRLLGYARHLIKTGRWEDLAEHFDNKHERGNSHSRRLPTYRRMLASFQPIWKEKVSGRGFGPDGFLLTPEELAEVVKAWPHPSAS